MANYRNKNKVKAIHKPPARVRYEQSHPVASCRLSKDEYDLLKQRLDDLGGVSFADFVREALGLLQPKIPDTKEIKEKARRAGYDQGRKEHQIWYSCAACGKPVYMVPNRNDHKAMLGYMKRWTHGECAQR